MQLIGRSLPAFIATLAIAAAALADALGDCSRASDPAANVLACSEVIAGTGYSVAEKAITYRNRGRARGQAGALDAAISDLNEAVKLNPADGLGAFGFGRGGNRGERKDYRRRQSSRLAPLLAVPYGHHDGTEPEPQGTDIPIAPCASSHAGLREPLTRGIAAPHDVMLKFKPPNIDIDRIVACITVSVLGLEAWEYLG